VARSCAGRPSSRAGFERRYLLGGEEALLAIDLAAAGWRLVYAQDVVAHHQPADRDRSDRSRLELRNRLWTAWLRRPAARALALSAELAGSGAAGRAALGDAARGLPWVLRRRRVVPPSLERALRLIED